MNILRDVEVAAESLEPPIPAFVRDLAAVAVAVVGRDGTLKEANRGFLDLMANPVPGEPAANVRDLFVNPRFSQFALHQAKRRDRVVYRGLLNLGRGDGRVVSLKGTVYGHGDDLLLVVAEYDVAELERLNATLWQLNQDLEQYQRELVRLRREAERQNALADAALRDRDTLLEALSMRKDPPDEDEERED
jgi:two-component system, cell cycle response regulator